MQGPGADSIRQIRLTQDHLKLNSWRKMRVNLASDVLSTAVAVALEQNISKGCSSSQATAAAQIAAVAAGSSSTAGGGGGSCNRPRATAEYVGKWALLFRLLDTKPNAKRGKQVWEAVIRSPDDSMLPQIEELCRNFTSEWSDVVKGMEGFDAQQKACILPAHVTAFCLQHV
jgi:hypothetical protein